MNSRTRVTGARVSSILALGSAVMIPWAGWWALGALGAFLVVGTMLTPRLSHPHRGRFRMLMETVRRRFARSPWRLKRL